MSLAPILILILFGLASCGSESARQAMNTGTVPISGTMDVRSAGPVVLGTPCTVEARRQLRIESIDGTVLERPSFVVGEWASDPDVDGAVVCPLMFNANVPKHSEYLLRVADSPPLKFSLEELSPGSLRFLDPSQFFNPSTYTSLSAVTTTSRP